MFKQGTKASADVRLRSQSERARVIRQLYKLVPRVLSLSLKEHYHLRRDLTLVSLGKPKRYI